MPALAKKRGGAGKRPQSSVANPPSKLKRHKQDKSLARLLSALDTYHDFGDNSRTQSSVKSFKNLLQNILKDLFDDDTEKKQFEVYASNFNTMKDKIYTDFISENKKLSSGYTVEITNGQGDPNEILTEINTEFKIDTNVSSIGIISDLSSYVGCRTEFINKYIKSYATWFDTNENCFSDKIYGNPLLLSNDLSLNKDDNDLFYIKKISGSIDVNNNNVAIGTITLDSEVNFSQSSEDALRPEVGKYTTYIDISDSENIKIIKDFDTHFKKFNKGMNVVNKILFLMDLKRSGDGLQIISGKHNVLRDNKTHLPVFITSDIIAATIAANKGVRTILTHKDPSRLGNEHAIKYATFLINLESVLTPSQIAELKERSLKAEIKTLKKGAEQLIEDAKNFHSKQIEALEEKLKELIDYYAKPTKQFVLGLSNRSKTLSDYYNASNTFKNYYVITYTGDKNKATNDYTSLKNQEENKAKTSTDPNNYIDLHIARATYSSILNHINTPPKFSDQTKNAISEAFNIYTTKILEYANDCRCNHTMSYYLRYILHMVNRYLEDEKYIDIILHLHNNVFNIYKATLTPDYNLLNDLIIANKYIRPIFEYDTIRYDAIIISDIDKKNITIYSVIGPIYIDYLLNINKPTKSKMTEIINTINLVTDLNDSIKQVLIKLPHSGRNVPKDEITNYHNNPTSSNKKRLKELYDTIFKTHKLFMQPFCYIPPRNSNSIEQYRCAIQGGSHSSSLKRYMDLSFSEKIKHIKSNPSLLKKIYLKYYENKKDKKEILLKELKFIQKQNAIHIPNYEFKEADMSNLGFQIFKEELYLSPQLIDPVMAILFVYTNIFMYPSMDIYSLATTVRSPQTRHIKNIIHHVGQNSIVRRRIIYPTQ